MKSVMTQIHRWLLPVVLFCLGADFTAKAQRVVGDPLLGIEYDPGKVHFEKLPPALREKCPRLRGRYVRAWLYGHFKTADTEYFVISGLVHTHEDKPGGKQTIAPEEGDGVVVALRGAVCLLDQTDYFFAQESNPAKHATSIVAPTPVLIEIITDAFRRCIVAFGDRHECLKQVHVDAIGPPIVRRQIEIFKNDSGK